MDPIVARAPKILVCLGEKKKVDLFNKKKSSQKKKKNLKKIFIYIPGTQMTLVLNGKGLLLEGSDPKIEDKQVPGIYIYIYH